ncbi:hypothetical protein OC835_001357 [Tilletia horrida]|nr:hypothetical protein OC835_001357 [Tilletia horrida]
MRLMLPRLRACLPLVYLLFITLLIISGSDAKVRRIKNHRFAQKSAVRNRLAIAHAAGEHVRQERRAPLEVASTEALTRELYRRIAELQPELARDFLQLSERSEIKEASALASRATSSSVSASRFAPTTQAAKDNIWQSLSDDEAADVIKYLHANLNLTAAENATSWSNMLTVIDLVPPNKTDALAYLDGSGPKPPRYAKATVLFGATDSPYAQDFAVGPLPVDGNTTYASLDYLTTSGTNRISIPSIDEDLVYEFYNNVSVSIADITQDLLGANNTLDDPLGVLDIWGTDPSLVEMKPDANGTMLPRTINWVTFWRTGLFFKVDITGRDPSAWTVDGWLYNNIFYESTDAFRAAWNSTSFEKVTINEPGDWGGTDRVGEPFKYDERVAPVSILPEGKRYAVDAERQYIEWGAFSFYLGFSRDAGVQLYDIRYNGERIVYHLGLQEAVAHYAGNDPVQSAVAYLDIYYGFGTYAFELIPGYDCPSGATYLNSSFHTEELSKTHRNSICLFEQDANLPIQRHASDAYTQATKNIQFVLRSVCTVGNYDYTFSYIFSMDGSIETKVSASGYIQSAHYAHNEEYGYRIHDGLSGSMHDHVLNYKVDIDVLGTANTFAKHGAVAVNATYPWLNGTRSTMKVNKTWLLNEDEGRLHWPYNGQTQYLVLNKNQTNKYGENPGYRIMPGAGGGGHHLSFSQSDSLKNAMGFARDHLYVTKQKDTEVFSSHANNNYDTENPIINFDKYLDGESLDQEDLVLWVNLGMTHIPHTGDLPTTVQTTAQSSFILLPHNYLLSDPSRRSRQQVRISYGEWQNDTTKLETFGQNGVPQYDYPLSNAYANLLEYQGDVAVRKFPYDPTHPFNDTDSII